MSHILVCRLCLATDVHLVAIANTPLQDAYENMTNIARTGKIHNTEAINQELLPQYLALVPETQHRLISMEKPIVACYLCVAQLRKCQKFTEQVIQADEVLTKMLQEGTAITPKSIALLDCKTLKLPLHLELSLTEVETLEYGTPLVAIKEEMLSEMEEVPCDEEEVETETEDFPPDKKFKLNRYSIEDPNSTVQEHCVPEKESIEFAAKEDIKEKITNAANEQEIRISINKPIMENIIYTHTGEKPYECTLCGYTSNHRSNLQVHLRTHTGEKPYECEECDYRCSDRSNLQRHIRTHTGEKPNKCTFCGYSSNHKSHLKVHLRTHTGDKLYECRVCGYRCRDRRNLQTHVITHTEEKPNICTLCGYSSNHKRLLQLHLRTHTGEKPYECEVCGYRCSDKSNLQRHVRTHTGEKPNKCTLCGYSSNHKSHLKLHLRTHTGEKPYGCEVCDFRCSDRSNLQKHVKKHTE